MGQTDGRTDGPCGEEYADEVRLIDEERGGGQRGAGVGPGAGANTLELG